MKEYLCTRSVPDAYSIHCLMSVVYRRSSSDALSLALGSALSTLNNQTVQHTRTIVPSYYCHELVYDAILLNVKAETLQDTVIHY